MKSLFGLKILYLNLTLFFFLFFVYPQKILANNIVNFNLTILPSVEQDILPVTSSENEENQDKKKSKEIAQIFPARPKIKKIDSNFEPLDDFLLSNLKDLAIRDLQVRRKYPQS